MTTLSILFWLSIAILFYCYVGYGFVAWIVNFFRVSSGNRVTSFERLPVTLVVTAFNEASLLGEKIRNSLMLQYPSELLEIIFITDGSRDGSTEIVNEYSQIRLLHQPERLGKYAAIKRAMRHVRTPIVVFSDANTLLNPESIEEIVKHYQDPSIGGVAGEKKIVDGSPIGAGEGLYWQYESYMKKLDADLYTVMGAAGELFSIRTELFQELDDNVILDDFVMSMQICLQGYRIAYEPGAYATELPSASLIEAISQNAWISSIIRC
jgi:cellulose synthase/poly-beta-1,6-N-acetylglucosamine synthase-like glycosyltransferase